MKTAEEILEYVRERIQFIGSLQQMAVKEGFDRLALDYEIKVLDWYDLIKYIESEEGEDEQERSDTK